jgi:hypothetical protein
MLWRRWGNEEVKEHEDGREQEIQVAQLQRDHCSGSCVRRMRQYRRDLKRDVFQEVSRDLVPAHDAEAWCKLSINATIWKDVLRRQGLSDAKRGGWATR